MIGCEADSTEAPLIVRAVEAVPLPEPPKPDPLPEILICQAAVDMVIQFEIISPAYYRKALERPIWPGGASGVTIGVGYDLGHQIPTVITLDWDRHPQAHQLPDAAGITGQSARSVRDTMDSVVTAYPLAADVFEISTVPRYWQMTRRAFPGIDDLTPCARGALFSLVYNRGSAMVGDRRREMRTIRDECIPRQDYHCIASQITAMSRIWAGTGIEAGMTRRRQAEATMVFEL